MDSKEGMYYTKVTWLLLISKEQNLSGFSFVSSQGFLVKHSHLSKGLLYVFYVWTTLPSLFFSLAYRHFSKPNSMRINMHNRQCASLNLHQQ